MRKAFLYLHQLPQNLAGLVLRLIYKGTDTEYNDALVRMSPRMQGGISLGRYIIVSEKATYGTVMHEYGHCIQSKYLGWLYLLVVGLPSIIRASMGRPETYYDFFTEKWADKLGGVKR